MNELRDSFDRHFNYLRLSLTEKCNFKCSYCLPNGYKPQSCEEDLSYSEINTLLSGFRELGFRKLRLTGGEPTLRRDIVQIVSLAKQIGFETVALSTNGSRLLDLLEPLKKAGLDQINISLDCLKSEKFAAVTGRDCGDQVLLAIHKAVAMGFRKIKVNAVLLKGINDDEFSAFVSWVRDAPISLRFIELMPTNENQAYFHKHHVKSTEWLMQTKQQGWSEIKKKSDAGPAVEFSHSEYKGEIGFIAPFRNNFCDSCNRLRVSSKGDLRLCLFGRGSLSLRPFLQNEGDILGMIELIEKTISSKKISHYLNQGDYGDTRTLSAIGG